jgi:hypothetical protein
MSKSLKTIQTIVKVARVIAKIVMILCIIGVVGSVFALGATVAANGLDSTGLLSSVTKGDMYFGSITALIACAAEIVLSFLAIKYFDNELAAGTPFTFDGSKELFRLGLINLAVGFGVSLLQVVVSGIIWLYFPEMELVTEESFSMSTGLFMMFLSLVFKYGAEVSSPAFSEYEEEKETIKF